MKRLCLVLLLCMTGGQLSAGTPTADPSETPLVRDDGTYGERFRLLGDINGDGYEDLLLSDDIDNLGQAGITYYIYLKNEEGKFVAYDSVYTSFGTITVERYHEDSRLWLFVRLNSQNGIISYCELGDEGITDCHSMRIHQGDGGTEIGKGTFMAVFGNSDVSFTLQKSTTPDGKITWENY